MTNKELFGKITRIAQGNIQEVVKPMLKRIIALEEAMDAKSTAPEVVQEPENYHGPSDMQLIQETLEGENDYVQQNLKEEEVE